MRKTNRKGFTLVELVIVIAVIAILAGVLIPTFGGIVDKANKSAAIQEATNTYKEYVASIDYTKNTPKTECWIETSKEYFVPFTNGVAGEAVKALPAGTHTLIVKANGVFTETETEVSQVGE